MDLGPLRHVVTLENPGTPIPDGDGGFTETWMALSPSTMQASIQPATDRVLERITSGTVESMATHVVTMRYHAGVTTKTRLTWEGRTFAVTGVRDPDLRHIQTIAICVERV